MKRFNHQIKSICCCPYVSLCTRKRVRNNGCWCFASRARKTAFENKSPGFPRSKNTLVQCHQQLTGISNTVIDGQLRSIAKFNFKVLQVVVSIKARFERSVVPKLCEYYQDGK